MPLTKQYLLFLLKLLESHHPNPTDQELDDTLKEIVGYFLSTPEDEDYALAIPEEHDNDEQIYSQLHENLKLAEKFMDDSTHLRMEKYECSHDELNTICAAFDTKRLYFQEQHPLSINPDIMDIKVYFVRLMLEPVHKNLIAQGVSCGVGKVYLQASNPDEASSQVREFVSKKSGYWAIESTDLIRQTSIAEHDDMEHDLEDIILCVESGETVFRIEVAFTI